MGAGRFPAAVVAPAGRSGRAHWGFGGGGVLPIGLALVFGRGGPC